MKKNNSSKCINCGAELWLGAFFEGPFLCSTCHSKAVQIIQRQKRRNAKLRKELSSKKKQEYNTAMKETQ